MFLEEALDALGSHGKVALLSEPGGDLLEAQCGLLNVFDQDPEGALRAQRGRWAGGLRGGGLLALLAIEMRVGQQVVELA